VAINPTFRGIVVQDRIFALSSYFDFRSLPVVFSGNQNYYKENYANI
jgi:hypothetical protein